ncbi:MAG TPA: hypothetical protein VK668_01310 [Mucilaginibacter sp.]|nr:hypothetical protein [Mucilaginibacter sp.]
MKILLPVLCLVLLFTACKKSSVAPYKYRGTITGYDLRECFAPVCGGLFINIDGNTTHYRTRETLTELGISESTKFPISISLDYKPDTGVFASYQYIIVTKIKVIP